jgi:drug/metabolite transporter (DMT)-like permease
MRKLNFSKGEILVLLSGLCYGLVGYFGVRIVELGETITNMLFWRFFIATIILAFFARKNLPDLKLSHIKIILFLSILYLGGSYIYFEASMFIGTGTAMVVFFSYPIMVVLINRWIYKSAITRYYIFAMIIILLGLILLIRTDSLKYDFYGILLAVISASFYAGYIVYSKANIKYLSPKLSAFMVCLGSCTLLFVYCLAKGELKFLGEMNLWMLELGNAILCTALPILLFLAGVKSISSSKAAILSVLEPIFVTIFGVMLLGESINLIQGIGIAVILSTIIIVQKIE